MNSSTIPAKKSKDHGQQTETDQELALALVGLPWGDRERCSRSSPRLAAVALEELLEGRL